MPTAAQVADPFGLAETKRKARWRWIMSSNTTTVRIVQKDGDEKFFGLPSGVVRIEVDGTTVWQNVDNNTVLDLFGPDSTPDDTGTEPVLIHARDSGRDGNEDD